MEVVGGLATEATKWSLTKIKKHIGYIYKYKENLKSLEDAEEKLDAKRKDTSSFLQNTNREQRDVSETTGLWKSKADKLYDNAQEIPRNNISCLNLCSRYSTSKNAWKRAQEINEEVERAPNFGTAFDRPLPKLGAKFNLAGFMEFKSRASVVDDVLKALTDDEVSICSIVGMGGTGKTTLAKKLVQRVETDRLFDNVAMVTVSEKPNFEKIQNEIIESLDLKISESTMTARATRLNDWLTNNRKTLLILDDVWLHFENEDFEKIGIPVVSGEGCKLVVTSRNEDECRIMGSHRNFRIKVLDVEEGWALFKHIAGKCVDDLKFQKTAKEIAHKCGGLPVVIVTLAAALKDKPNGVWKDSLLKLKKSHGVGISEMKKVYSRLQLSYDLLNDSEAQACFRLCCLFPEDHNIPAEDFVRFGKGLQLFGNVESMSETRDRVESIIDKLKKSFLLLDGWRDGTVKMHDILRDFAKEISSQEYIEGFEDVKKKWPETSRFENCSAISLMWDKINGHPVGLRLKLKYNGAGLPIGIFEGMKELKVLDLAVPSLLQPLTPLKKLRYLRVIENNYKQCEGELPYKIGELLGHGDLKNLEFLEFATYRPRNDFPEGIGLLCNLRCLYLGRMRFQYIPSGVLSKLLKLEELELPPEFDRWGCQVTEGGQVNASLDEIESLPLITTLRISVQSWSEKLVKNLTRFNIGIGTQYKVYTNSTAMLSVFHSKAPDVTASWMSFLRKCDTLHLEFVDNLENIMCLQSADEDNEWKHISIRYCEEMEYLVDTIAERIPSSFFSQLLTLTLENMDSLKEICPFSKIEAPWPCFSNLSEIHISECRKLKHVFPVSVARELKQLQIIVIRRCDEMEEIVYNDLVDDANQVQSSVQLITPRIETTSILNPSTSVNSSNDICPTPNSFFRSLLGRGKQPKNVSIPQNMEEKIAEVEEKEVDDAIIFPQLKTLKLLGLKKLRILYVGNHAIEFPSLEELIIVGCNKMEGLSYGSFNAPRLKQINIDMYDEDEDNGFQYLVDTIAERIPSSFFSQLQTLKLYNMDSLREICPFSKIEAPWPCFSNLSEIQIFKCPKLKHVFPVSVARELKQLQIIDIWYCEEMEEVFYRDQVEDTNQVVSTSDPSTSVNSKTLKSFFRYVPDRRTQLVSSRQNMEENIAKVEEKEVDDAIIFPQLKRLELKGLDKLRILYDGNHAIEFPSLKELIIEGCNKMEGLSYGSFSAPRLEDIKISGIVMDTYLEDEDNGFQYLVDTIAERIPSSFFSQLQTLELRGMDSLREICPFSKIEAPWPCFSNLSVIEISRCPKMKHVFPVSVARELKQLQTIEIWYCEEMEEVFYRDQVEDANQVVSTSDPSTSVNSKTLKSFFRYVPDRRTQLVSSCQIMVENIAKVEEKEVDHAIIFPRLKKLILYHMPKLRVLFDGNHTIEFPSLRKLRITQCNKMEALSFGSLKAPSLKKVIINDGEIEINVDYIYPVEEDLNAFVKKIKLDVLSKEKEKLDAENDIEKDDNDSRNDIKEENDDNIVEIHHVTN